MRLQPNENFDTENHINPDYLSDKNKKENGITKRLLINFKKLEVFNYIYNTLKGRGHNLKLKYGHFYAVDKQQTKEIFIKTDSEKTIETIQFLLTIKNPKKWLLTNQQ